MSLVGHIFSWYCILSLVLAISLMLDGLYDDIKCGPDYKFGYHYKSGLFWFLVFGSLPVANLLVASLILYARFLSRR